jgi:hypothetical protein
MRLPLSFFVLSTLVAGGIAVGVAASVQDPQDPRRTEPPDGVHTTHSRALPVDDEVKTLLLTVELDSRGARTVLITPKDEEFVPPGGSETMPFGWIVRDAAGKALAEGGFDPGVVDLDPANFGQPGTYQGDIHIPTATATLVAIPALADFATIQYFQRGGAVQQPFGFARRDQIQVR